MGVKDKYIKILYYVVGLLFIGMLIFSMTGVARLMLLNGDKETQPEATPIPTQSVKDTPVVTPSATPLAAAAVPTPTPEPTPEPTPKPTPEPIMASEEELETAPEATPELPDEYKEPGRKLRIFAQYNYNYISDFYDGKDSTYNSVHPNGEIKITAGEPIGMLYIKWQRLPGEWTLRYGDQEIICGQNGFQHELIRISEPTDTLYMIMNGDHEHTITEIEAYTEGSLPENVQDWQPPCEKADLLIFPTHSMDEFIFMGGLIPKYVEEGKKIQVCYLVDHRYNERLDSLWEAGVRNYPLTSPWGDFYCATVNEAKNVYNFETIIDYITEQIRRFEPLVIVGHDPNGETGHAVHISYVMALQEALKICGNPAEDPESAEQYGVWQPAKVYLHLYDKSVTLDYETPLDKFDGRTAFEVAEDAFERCVSQYQVGKYDVYGTGHQLDSHLYGLYESQVGEDTECVDLFEHIPSDYRQQAEKAS